MYVKESRGFPAETGRGLGVSYKKALIGKQIYTGRRV